MKTTKWLSAAAGLCAGLLTASSALAHEPGTPNVMPSGATMGVPVGANFPVEGLYFSSRTALVRGNSFDAEGNQGPVGLDINVTAAQIHWTPGWELLGGTYRAMAILAYQDLDLTLNGTSIGDNTSLSDLTISPLNVHWMLQPGVFASAGISFSLPVGDFSTAQGAVNGGRGAPAVGVDFGYSYLRDGWNLSAHVNYFHHFENPETNYQSGDQILLNWTAMRAIGESGWSAGLVGYERRQITDDRNNGTFYRGATAERARESGIGLAVARRFGPIEVYADYTRSIAGRNTIAADQLRLNVTFPLGGGS
ncbi:MULTISPECIES: SphA family protein [Roseicyclus]|uniref:SphA family protein n=1 Tax=Roseicyclus amphidinii TaxID=3034232 RepID=UPI0024E1364F|nr:transporter [Roseicyclus sp. Amp-Y-6]